MLINNFFRNQGKVMLCTLIIFMFVLLSSCFYNQNSDYVVTIDGEKITIPEFKVYFYEVQLSFEEIGGYDIWETDFDGIPALNIAKERAFNSIAHIKITSNKASSMGIKLSQEDKQTAIDEAKQLLDFYNDDVKKYIGITNDQLVKVMEQKILRNKVYDEVTKNYQVSSADFESYYQQYLKEQDSNSELLSRTEVEEKYINSMKDKIFESEYKRWSNGVGLEKNQEQWDNVDIYK